MIVRFDQDRLLLVKIRTVCFRLDRTLSTVPQISANRTADFGKPTKNTHSSKITP